jgi:EAL domain-containing protein (putative c-di-GMP-specific phosphodiesterase class I)
MERVLGAVDIGRFHRSQSVYSLSKGGHGDVWRTSFAEWFTDVGALREALFPKVDLAGNPALLREFCRCLDCKELDMVLKRRPSAESRISLNLTMPTLQSPLFRDFGAQLGARERQNLLIEIDLSDLVLDFRDGVKQIAELRRQGYGIVLDGVVPDLLPLLNPAVLDVDLIKIRLSADLLPVIRDRAAVTVIGRIDRNRVVLIRCDTDAAVTVGRTFGFTLFQGWAIDRLAGAPLPSPKAAAVMADSN